MPLLYAERMAISGVAVATPERLALTPLGSVAVGAATAAAVHMRSRYKRHMLICGTGRMDTQHREWTPRLTDWRVGQKSLASFVPRAAKVPATTLLASVRHELV